MITHIYDFLQKSVDKYPNKKLFVEFNGKYISYKKFHSMSEKLASEILRQLACEHTTQLPILIILPKSIDCLISFFGVALSGNFYTILDEKTPKERIK
ncbi:AMP-binding protein, partial [Campylobacter sp. VicNov18]